MENQHRGPASAERIWIRKGSLEVLQVQPGRKSQVVIDYESAESCRDKQRRDYYQLMIVQNENYVMVPRPWSRVCNIADSWS